ncbi:TPA: hypothetical protein DEB72_03390 [Patescibacteria group bacterium]|nr:hypothetical protein [Patescibacteria group bacterium]
MWQRHPVEDILLAVKQFTNAKYISWLQILTSYVVSFFIFGLNLFKTLDKSFEIIFYLCYTNTIN